MLTSACLSLWAETSESNLLAGFASSQNFPNCWILAVPARTWMITYQCFSRWMAYWLWTLKELNLIWQFSLLEEEVNFESGIHIFKWDPCFLILITGNISGLVFFWSVGQIGQYISNPHHKFIPANFGTISIIYIFARERETKRKNGKLILFLNACFHTRHIFIHFTSKYTFYSRKMCILFLL